MDFLLEALTNWLKEMLVGGIMSNLSGMFDSVNQQVADISCLLYTSGVILVHNVAERGKIIVPSGTVHTVIDGDKANATLTQNFHNLTYFQIVTTHAAHVLDTQILHIPGFHFFHHCQKSGTVKAGTIGENEIDLITLNDLDKTAAIYEIKRDESRYSIAKPGPALRS